MFNIIYISIRTADEQYIIGEAISFKFIRISCPVKNSARTPDDAGVLFNNHGLGLFMLSCFWLHIK